MQAKSDTPNLANQLRRAREAAGHSPVQLAQQAGVSAAVVGALESGEFAPVGMGQLLQVLAALRLDLTLQAAQPLPEASASTAPSAPPVPTPRNLRIRSATAGDASAISQLIASVMPALAQEKDVAQWVADPAYKYLAGWLGDTLAGVVALRDNTHVFHLFVHPTMQRRGLGRKLWLHAKAHAVAAGNRSGLTVNAAPDAVPVYEQFGFVATGEKAEMNSIAYVPMRLSLEPSYPGE
jgi:GNAT superfamily N-acetyltransferase